MFVENYLTAGTNGTAAESQFDALSAAHENSFRVIEINFLWSAVPIIAIVIVITMFSRCE